MIWVQIEVSMLALGGNLLSLNNLLLIQHSLTKADGGALVHQCLTKVEVGETLPKLTLLMVRL